jgi:hypothetical protein
MSEDTIAVLDRLAERFPAVRSILDQHLADNFGEVLPHVLMGEIAQYIVDLAVEANESELQGVLDSLEVEFERGSEEVQELLAVSFLENLPRPPAPGCELRRQLGPNLSRELARMEAWRPAD